MMKNLLDWFLDPKAPGRKRGLACALFLAASLLRWAETAIAAACDKALLVGTVCSVHVAGYATWFDVAYQAVDQFLVPGTTATAAAVGIWGLFHAAQRNHVVYPLDPPK